MQKCISAELTPLAERVWHVCAPKHMYVTEKSNKFSVASQIPKDSNSMRSVGEFYPDLRHRHANQ
jgi:hypothetical protein